MAVRINFHPDSSIPSFFEKYIEEGKFGERFVQFSSIGHFEQVVMHSRLMKELPEDITVTDLSVIVSRGIIEEIGSSGTFEFMTNWGSARIVINCFHLTIEATDPRSFLDAHRAILNGLISQDHKLIVQNY